MNNPALEVIKYIMEDCEFMEDSNIILELWYHGEFDELRKLYPDMPTKCFIGADPLLEKPGE